MSISELESLKKENTELCSSNEMLKKDNDRLNSLNSLFQEELIKAQKELEKYKDHKNSSYEVQLVSLREQLDAAKKELKEKGYACEATEIILRQKNANLEKEKKNLIKVIKTLSMCIN